MRAEPSRPKAPLINLANGHKAASNFSFMTAEEKIHSSSKRPITLSPWLVTIGALLLYGITLQHWVTLSSLPIISRVTGWDWHPIPLAWRQTQAMPLFFVLTAPVRILPVGLQPLALNIFSAICGALTLGLLAASVRLLPHDRTREQRQREGGEFSLLSVRAAFLPALFAVFMMAFQLHFWRGATATTGDMLDLLVFSFLVFCLLKFRIAQNENWLFVFAFVYGLGTTNNWALIWFFPLFLAAMVWIMGVNFFNGRFLGRTAGFGLLGLLLYLLIPAIASLGSERANFMAVLHMEWGAQSFGLRMVPRWIGAVAALPTLLPLLFAGFKWPSFEGELSAAGNTLTRLMFRLLHVVFLLLALVLFFDFKYSPSLRLAEAPVGFLTFYYIGALCIGYFSGYVLLVYGKDAAQGWDSRSPVTSVSNFLVVGLFWLLAIAAPSWLFYKSVVHINAGKSNVLADYSAEIMRDLPAKPVLVLSDDPNRLYLLDAAYQRAGKPNNNIMIETGSLPYREYISYLVSRYPDVKKLTPDPARFPHVMAPSLTTEYLYTLSKKYPVYYLQPSFGYFFEIFYLKPHGLVYDIQPYPKNVIQPPPPSPQDVAENEAIWARLEKGQLPGLSVLAKLDPDTANVAVNYSVGLDVWGVMLQKANYLKQAGAQFAEAVKIDPQNYLAKVNAAYNERLQKNDHRPLNTEDQLYRALVAYRGLVPLLKFNGPPDEPDVNLKFGELMAEGKDFRQSAILFDRRLQLLPGDVSAELDLAKVFVDWHVYDKALEMVATLRSNPAANKWEATRVEALAYLGKGDFLTAEKLFRGALQEAPQDGVRVATLADFYRTTAYRALSQENEAMQKKDEVSGKKYSDEAHRRFNNALAYLDQQTQLLAQNSHNTSTPFGVVDVLQKKAEVEMMLRDFKAAISTLNQLLELQPNNATAVLNRAIAEMQLNQLAPATDDYKLLRKLRPDQRYVVDYGLADIAARRTNTTEEIRCLKRYLDSAPDDTREYQQATQRLKKLEIR